MKYVVIETEDGQRFLVTGAIPSEWSDAILHREILADFLRQSGMEKVIMLGGGRIKWFKYVIFVYDTSGSFCAAPMLKPI